ncbi:MAG: sensor histidine kinase, partial [Jannaschia sp.]
VFLAYSAYASCGLLFVMHGDGNAFQYLWPNRPLINDSASILIGTGLIVFGGHFSRVFLQTRIHNPVFDALILAVMGIGLALAASAVIVDPQWVKKTLILFAFVSLVLYAVAGFNAARKRFREVRFYVLAWAGAVISSGIMTSRHWFGFDISQEAQYNSMRIVLVMDAALMGLAILDRIEQLKRTRERSLQTSLEVTRRNLALSTRLRELEKRYDLALELGERRERDIADVVHDLRQPIHALRLSVQTAVADPSGPVAPGDVEETFSYLENLVESYLDGPRAQGAMSRARPGSEGPELHAVDTVLQGLRDLTEADARLRGVDLRIVPSGLRTPVPPLHLMRLLSNLVRNSLRHAGPGKVLVGLRRAGPGRARLEVHDTGPGLNEADFARAVQRSVRLRPHGDAEGRGLGLSIVTDLCTEHGLSLHRLPRPDGAGLSLAIVLPVVPDEPSASASVRHDTS